MRAVARDRFKLDGERRSEAVERRAKIHFRREQPIGRRGLAQRRRFSLNKCQRLSEPKKIERERFSEIGLGEDG